MRTLSLGLAALACLMTGACSDAGASARPAEAAPPQSAAGTGQRGGGAPYEVLGSQVWDVPDPASGREYQVFVQLPPSYAAEPDRRYPVLFVTDADYAFPIIRQLGRRLNLDGPAVEEFILVGLSYAQGDNGAASRNRDYTPTANGPRRASSTEHGGGPAYQAYLKTQVLPFMDARFRTDPSRRILLGHSYGALLGLQILFTEPELFSGYALGSPSIWFDQRHVLKMEADYAARRTDLDADVFIYIGEFEGHGPTPQHTTGPDMVADVATLEATLRSRNYPGLTLGSEVLNDEDHLSVAPRGFTRALFALLPAR